MKKPCQNTARAAFGSQAYWPKAAHIASLNAGIFADSFRAVTQSFA
jgi:hypothetical protein